MARPLTDLSEDELRQRLRSMYEAGNYVSSPNDIYRALQHRQAARYARMQTITSIVGVAVATIAVVLSAVALIIGAGR